MEILSFTTLVSIFLAFLSSYALWRIKKNDDKAEAAEEDIKRINIELSTIKATSITKSEARDMMKEELDTISRNVNKLVESTSTIEIWIAEERGFRKGLQSLRKNEEQ